MEGNLTDILIYYLNEKKQHITEELYKKAKRALVDYIGVTIAGAQENKERFLKNESMFNDGSCSVLGYRKKTDMKTAAFINGFNAHTVELDDGHRMGMIHLGASIISAVLAAAQQYRLSMEPVLTGIIIGYEAAVRVAMAMQPVHKIKGFHTSGTCGTIGAALAVAYALDFDFEQIKTTLSAAATSAAGLLEIQEDDSQLKPYNVANAAMSGVMAADIGKLSFCGPSDILGGDRGMLKLLSDNKFSSQLLSKKTDYFEIERIYVKPYAACRHCHSAIEAAIELRKQYNIPAEYISCIKIYTYSLAIKGHDHKDIKGIASAKLSMPYSVAAAYIIGRGDINTYSEENIKDVKIINLMQKVEIYEKSEFNGLKDGQRVAEVFIETFDGIVVKKQVEYAKGDPENPMSEEEIRDKCISLVRLSGIDDIISVINELTEQAM